MLENGVSARHCCDFALLIDRITGKEIRIWIVFRTTMHYQTNRPKCVILLSVRLFVG